MAGRQGFEPRYADPESAVLPLDDLPLHLSFLPVPAALLQLKLAQTRLQCNPTPLANKLQLGLGGCHHGVNLHVFIRSMSVAATRPPQHRRRIESLVEHVHIAWGFNSLDERLLTERALGAFRKLANQRLAARDGRSRQPANRELDLWLHWEKLGSSSHNSFKPIVEVFFNVLLLLTRHHLPVHLNLADFRDSDGLFCSPRACGQLGNRHRHRVGRVRIKFMHRSFLFALLREFLHLEQEISNGINHPGGKLSLRQHASGELSVRWTVRPPRWAGQIRKNEGSVMMAASPL